MTPEQARAEGPPPTDPTTAQGGPGGQEGTGAPGGRGRQEDPGAREGPGGRGSAGAPGGPRAEDPAAAPDDRPREDLAALAVPFRGVLGPLAVPVNGLMVLALVFTLHAGREFLVPVTAAILLNFLLTPVVRALGRLGLPQAAGASLVMLSLLAVLGLGVHRLSGPAGEWIESAPETVARARVRVEGFLRSVEEVREAVDDIGSPAEDGAERVQVEGQSLSDRLVDGLGSRVVGAVAALFLLFFLLASGDRFLRKTAGVLPSFHDRRRLVEIARRTERDLSRYLLTTTAINVCLGTAVGLALWTLGMPNPTLWGVLAALLNFVPYVGGLVGVLLIGLVSLATFDSPGAAVAPPVAYLALNTLEAYLVTPTIMGRRFSLNPVVVFVSVFFWSWIWGVAGALMAVPILTTGGIVCNRIEKLSPLARMLER